MLLANPPLLQAPRRNLDAIAREIVQHHNVRARRNRLVRLRLALHLDFNLHAESRNRLGRRHSLGDAAPAPDVVVLEHHHRAQIHPVPVCTANQHAVLLHQAKPRRRLARSRQHAAIARRPQLRDEQLALRRHARAPRKRIQRNPLAQQEAPRRTGHGSDLHLAAVAAEVEMRALFGVPLDGAAALVEDLVEKGSAGDDAGGLAPEGGGAEVFADDEASIVERGRVFGEPGGDLGLPAGGEEVCEGRW